MANENINENENMKEGAREKSFNASPTAINKVTLGMVIFFIIVVIIGSLMIGGFFAIGNDGVDERRQDTDSYGPP